MKAYQFFAGCNSTEEAKKRYYRLAQENHPDHGGDPETMKAINAEFERFCKEGPTGGADRDDLPEEFIRVIVRIITLDGLTAEIIGRWVWVTGNTYQHKDALKEAGFRWASKKKAWYWHRPEDAVKGSHRTTLEGIRRKYGSEVITAAKAHRLALQA